MLWYQALYEIALLIALWRGRNARWQFPWFYAWMLLSVISAGDWPRWNSASWSIFVALAALRVLSSAEAYAAVTLGKFAWSPGSQLLLFAWLAAAALTFVSHAFIRHQPIDSLGLLEFRRFAVIWNGIWMMIALVFLVLWGVSEGNRAHCGIVAALSWLAASGALAKLAGASDSAYWTWDVGLYLGQGVLLLVWAAIIARQ